MRRAQELTTAPCGHGSEERLVEFYRAATAGSGAHQGRKLRFVRAHPKPIANFFQGQILSGFGARSIQLSRRFSINDLFIS